MDTTFQFLAQFGLPFALVAFALIMGARGWWYFGRYVDDLRKTYDFIISDKDAQIKMWKEIADKNATTANESLGLSKEARDTLVRIEKRLEQDEQRRNQPERSRGQRGEER